MEYVELLRARRSLSWHLGILAILTLGALYLAHEALLHVHGSGASHGPVQLSWLTWFATVFAAIYASSAGTSLNRENATRDISWTKPAPRTLVALRFVLIDVAAVIVVFAATFLLETLVLVSLQVTPVLDSAFGEMLELGLGASLMWYALIQVLTCRFGPGARSIGGILWPVALTIDGLAQVPGVVGSLAMAVDVVNPLAYVGSSFGSSSGARATLNFVPADVRALAVWLFAVLFCAVAVTIWPRKEA